MCLEKNNGIKEKHDNRAISTSIVCIAIYYLYVHSCQVMFMHILKPIESTGKIANQMCLALIKAATGLRIKSVPDKPGNQYFVTVPNCILKHVSHSLHKQNFCSNLECALTWYQSWYAMCPNQTQFRSTENMSFCLLTRKTP